MRFVSGLVLSIPLAFLALQPASAQTPLPKEKPAPVIPGTAGKGPLTLIASAAVTYQEYFAHDCPQVLAVDSAGWATHATLGTAESCPASGITQELMRQTLSACDAFTAHASCSIVAVGKKIVWDGPISYLPGRYIPQSPNQHSIVLRKVRSEDDISTTFATSVGLVTRVDDYKAAIRFKRDNEIGVCRGVLKRHDVDTATIDLTCTKLGQVTGTIALNEDGKTGAGTAAGIGERQFEITILPLADFMKDGASIQAADSQSDTPQSETPMTNDRTKGAS